MLGYQEISNGGLPQNFRAWSTCGHCSGSRL